MTEITMIEPEAAEIALLPEARAAIALQSTQTEMHLRTLATKHASIVEIKDKPGREQAHGAAMELKRARTNIERVGKDARDDATKFSKAVIAEEKRLVGIIDTEEKRLLALRDNWDEAEEKRKEAEAAAERARVLAITEKITAIRAYVTLAAQCRTSERVTDLIAKVAAIDITAEAFAEFEAEAIEAKRLTLEQMEQTELRLQEEEAERARVKAEQEAAAAKLAAERAELARQQAEAAAAEAQAKAQRDAEAAELQRQRDAFAAEQTAVRAAQQAEAARLAEQAAELERKAQAQRDAEAAAEMAAQPAIDHEAVQASDQADSTITGQADDSDVVDAEFTAADPLPYIAPTPQAAEPSDGDVIAVAARAVADAFGLTFVQAAQRLARVEWATN